MPLKVALVGCGKIADAHAEEVTKLPDRARLVAVCDRELLMAEQLAARFGIAAHYDSYDEMLRKERPDVVHITAPPQSHAALAAAAIDAGCHVFVEKPLTPTYAESRALVERAERADRRLTVNYAYLFDPPSLDMQRLLAGGLVGEVVHVESWSGYDLASSFGSAVFGDPTHWVHALPGKLLHNTIDHLLSRLLRFIDDDDPAIQAAAWQGREADVDAGYGPVHDELRVIIRGARVSGYATFSARVRPVANFLRVYGDKATLHVDYDYRTVTLAPSARLPTAFGRVLPAFAQAGQYFRQGWRNATAFGRGDFHFFAGFSRLICRFYDSIDRGAPPPIASRDMLRVALWMERIFEQTMTRVPP